MNKALPCLRNQEEMKHQQRLRFLCINPLPYLPYTTMLNNFQPSFIFRHPVFLVTFIIAIPAWIIAFAAQCAAEAQICMFRVPLHEPTLTPAAATLTREPVVKYLWFNIWIQLAVIVHLLCVSFTPTDRLTRQPCLGH